MSDLKILLVGILVYNDVISGDTMIMMGQSVGMGICFFICWELASCPELLCMLVCGLFVLVFGVSCEFFLSIYVLNELFS